MYFYGYVSTRSFQEKHKTNICLHFLHILKQRCKYFWSNPNLTRYESNYLISSEVKKCLFAFFSDLQKSAAEIQALLAWFCLEFPSPPFVFAHLHSGIFQSL